MFSHRHNQGSTIFQAQRRLVRERNLNRFADALAEVGTITGAAKAVGISQQRGSQLFKIICNRLGWQAQ